MRTRVAILASLLAVAPARTDAQDGRVYAGASAFLSTQDSHRQGSSPSLPLTGVGGTTIGAGGEVGVFLTDHFGVGVEVALPARIEVVQETDYTRVFQIENRYRDLMLSAVARVRSAPFGPIRVAVLGGAGLVQESSLQRRRDALGLFPLTAPLEFGPYGDEIPTTRWTYGALFGGELEIALSSHVALVPGMRVHWVRRSDDAAELMWFLGLSSMVYRPSIGLRASF